MVIIKCQHSGIEFEASSKRTKQHPLVAEIKQRGNKDGNYREVNDALDTVAKEGNYETIEEYMTQVKNILAGKKEERLNAWAERQEIRRKEEEAREQAKRERYIRNETLKANGYKWEKYETTGYYAGVTDEPEYEWILVASDGRIVTEAQAFEEIERGVEVVKSEIEAEKQAEAEAKKQAEAENRERLEKFRQARDTAESFTQVEAFETDLTVVASYDLGMTTHSVKQGAINGVTVYTVEQVGDMDATEYYCVDHVKAGLEALPDDDGDEYPDYFSI